MDSRPLAVRRMTESELALALDWAANEGWNPGLSDAECFCAVDPDGFFLGELDGEPVGCPPPPRPARSPAAISHVGVAGPLDLEGAAEPRREG